MLFRGRRGESDLAMASVPENSAAGCPGFGPMATRRVFDRHGRLLWQTQIEKREELIEPDAAGRVSTR